MLSMDVFAAIMAVLSVLSFGLIAPVDVAEETQITVPTANIPSGNPATQQDPGNPNGNLAATPAAKPTVNTQLKDPAALSLQEEGAKLIAGTWKGSASVPFVIKVNFNANVNADGTAVFYGNIESQLFGDHEFDTEATWEYYGNNKFNCVISDTDTPVTCDGKKLEFPLNPYKLGLTDNTIADQTFSITLNRA